MKLFQMQYINPFIASMFSYEMTKKISYRVFLTEKFLRYKMFSYLKYHLPLTLRVSYYEKSRHQRKEKEKKEK